MKKRLFVLGVMLSMAAIILSSCGTKAKCDFCGEEKSCQSKSVLGEEVNICNGCMNELSELYN